MASGIALRIFSGALHAQLEGPTGWVARDLARRAERVRSRASALAPVDTGRLRSSITWRMGFDGGIYAEVGTNVFYGIYQELGTRYMRAHPYLIPALAAAA